MTLLQAGLGLVGIAAVVAACGPSFQVVYEGDARFEHCYAIDDTPTVPMQEKTECWTQWMKRYTYGQTRNRVDYAAMRAKALQEAHSAPTDEAMMGAAPGGGTGHMIGQDEPVTTNAFATPPKTMSDGDAAVDTTSSNTSVQPVVKLVPVAPFVPAGEGANAPTPGQACTTACRSTWDSCRGDAGKAVANRTCDKTYGKCMQRCF